MNEVPMGFRPPLFWVLLFFHVKAKTKTHPRTKNLHDGRDYSLKGAALGLGPGLIDVDMRDELAEDTITVFMLFC